jgi:hypothetical protein
MLNQAVVASLLVLAEQGENDDDYRGDDEESG